MEFFDVSDYFYEGFFSRLENNEETWFLQFQAEQDGRNIHPEVFYKIDVLKDFTKLTGQHLCWILILIKLQTGGLQL